MTLSIDYDPRSRLWRFACTCSWSGTTSNLGVAAAPLAEHSRYCSGEKGKRGMSGRYDVDSHERGRRREADKQRTEAAGD